MKGPTIFLIAVIAVLCLPLAMVMDNTIASNEITQNDEFFELSIAEVPNINADTWGLPIDGQIGNPQVLSFQQITSMPNVTIVGTLKCPEGPSGTAE